MSNGLTVESTIQSLLESVIDGGYCIGCGACAVADQSPFEIVMNDKGQYVARLRFERDATSHMAYDIRSVCPFAAGNPNEDQLARNMGFDEGTYTHGIGYSLATFAGYVLEGDFRERGSSGGLVTWLLTTMLEQGLIDAVIHVREVSPKGGRQSPLFTMQISRTVEEVRAGAKSRYYPVEMSEVLKEVKECPGRYALVGVPCFVKAVRLLALQEPVIRERIAYCVSLVCGHLKSDRFARMLAWEAGIEPHKLRTIDFRRKLADRPANRYAVEFVTKDGDCKVVPIDELQGCNWGYGFFKYQACDYCDDVVGETADVSVGDAWLPEYVSDPQGTNVVVVRDKRILQILVNGINEHRLSLVRISPATVVESQDAGIRHRRQGLAYRLYLKERRGEWFPVKRVRPQESHLTEREKAIHELRIQLRVGSHEAFAAALEKGNFSEFTRRMRPLLAAYHRLYRPSLVKRFANKIRRLLAAVLRT